MNLLLSLLAATLVVICSSSCSSEQPHGPADANQSPPTSDVMIATAESPIAVEFDVSNGRSESGITPMDVTKGRPTAPTSSTPADPEAVTLNISKPGLPEILGDGNGELRVVRVGKPTPGEGPRGPDGKVIDPQTFLEQLREKKAQQAAKNTPQPVARPLNVSKSAPATAVIKRLDPSEAPKLPMDSAPKKTE